VDEAFLRRIRYKIHVDDPTESQYNEIFSMVCEAKGVPFDPEAVEYLLREYYQRHRRPLRACHPRDLVEHVIDLARFNEEPPSLTQQALDHICRTYFIDG
jgi:SpoVK/Ycf46/Vps4 family AAA+-type ATPase